MSQERLNIAVFIDFDNIEIGVKQTLGQQFDVGIILDAIKERGEVVTKIAYADWTRSGEYSRSLTQHAIRLVQRNMTPGGDKNGADINLALDALEMAFTHSHINAYVIVGGDSDFLSLVEKLKQYDKKVFVVGGRAFTSMILQRNCHEFIAYENLAGVRKAAAKQGRPMPAAAASAPIAQALPVVRRALKILADREVTPQTGLLKSTLLQLDSTFSERNYGASSFLDFVEKLAASGFVQLKTSGRSVMVELNPGYVEESRPAAEGEDARRHGCSGARRVGDTGRRRSRTPPSTTGYGDNRRADNGGGGFRPQGDGSHGGVQEPAGPPLGDQADGVRRAGQILGAASGARWPMYLRNVKQILRQTEGGFDERRYGFGGLMDLLKDASVRASSGSSAIAAAACACSRAQRFRVALAPPAISRPNLPQPDVEEYENQPIEAPQPVMRTRGGVGRRAATRASRFQSTPPRSCSAAPNRASRAPARRVPSLAAAPKKSGGEKAGRQEAGPRQEVELGRQRRQPLTTIGRNRGDRGAR